jgi:hypothetical protein
MNPDPFVPPKIPQPLPGIPHDLTPRKHKEQNGPYVANSDVLRPEANVDRWVARVECRLFVYTGPVSEFISSWVPSSAADYDPPANLGCSAVSVPKGRAEDDMYGPLVRGILW